MGDVEETNKKLGNRIRQLRLAKSWSQEQLADETGLHRTYIGGIERGLRNPAVQNVARIAHALGVPISALFEVDPQC